MITEVRPAAEAPVAVAEPLQSRQAGNQETSNDVGPRFVEASYLSPVVRLDTDTQTALLVFRDSGTGETLFQYPSERTLQQYKDIADQAARDAASKEQAAVAAKAEQAAAEAQEAQLAAQAQVQQTVGPGISAVQSPSPSQPSERPQQNTQQVQQIEPPVEILA